jgi:hypothetical protein
MLRLQKRTFVEGCQQASRIELVPHTAAMFPYFLDYVYLRFSSPRDAESFWIYYALHCVDLYWVADYFQVSRLCLDLKRLWETRMELIHCPIYIRRALEVGVEPILYTAVDVCADRLLEIGNDELNALAKSMDATCLKHMLEKQEMTEDRSRKASELRCIDEVAKHFDTMDTRDDGPLCSQSALFIRKSSRRSPKGISYRLR